MDAGVRVSKRERTSVRERAIERKKSERTPIVFLQQHPSEVFPFSGSRCDSFGSELTNRTHTEKKIGPKQNKNEHEV